MLIRCEAARSDEQRRTRYLEREYLTNFKHSRIVLLRPTMSFMLMQTPDPRTIKVRATRVPTQGPCAGAKPTP